MFRFIFVFATLIALQGCSTPNPVVQLEGAINHYKRVNAPQKAMAVGYAPNGHWVLGQIFGQGSLDEAAGKSLASCREKSLAYGGTHQCRVVYLNNDYQNPPAAVEKKEPFVSQPTPKIIPPDVKTKATGSGIFIDGDGLILTAEHVVRDATSIEVVTRNGEKYSAKIESLSRSLDVAILRVKYESKAYFPLRSAPATAGTRVFTVGYPVPGLLGQEPKVNEGIISSVSGIRDDASFMQISIPIQPGNSGGPVITEKGELVGVVTSTAAVSNFLKRTGTLPQSVNWAARAAMAVPLIAVEHKPRAVMTRDAAVQEAIAASVMILVAE